MKKFNLYFLTIILFFALNVFAQDDRCDGVPDWPNPMGTWYYTIPGGIGAKFKFNYRLYISKTNGLMCIDGTCPNPTDTQYFEDIGLCGDNKVNVLNIGEGMAIVPTWKDGALGAYSMVFDDFGDMPFDLAVKPAWDLVREPEFSDIKLAWGVIGGLTSDADYDSAVIMVSQGHEMLDHSMHHFSGAELSNHLIDEKIYRRINTAGEYFAKGKKCEFYIFPFDEMCCFNVLDNAGFVGARGGERRVVMNGDFTYNVASIWHENNSSRSTFRIPFEAWYGYDGATNWTLKFMVDEIISKKGYAIREFHSVVDTVPVNWWGEISKGILRSHLEYVKQKMDANELAVYTPSEAVKYRMTALAFEEDAILTAIDNNWKIKLNMKDNVVVQDKYKDEISVIVNLGVAVEKLAVAYDGNPLNTNSDNSPRIKPKNMDNEGKIWSVSINPFKSSDNSALLIREGVWFGQGVDIETCEICKTFSCKITHILCSICETYDCDKTHNLCEKCGEYDCNACDASSIVKIQKSDNKHGIKFAQNIVSDKAYISIILPNNEKATETKITVYDMTGNIVFEYISKTHLVYAEDAIVWDLHNNAGRNVAGGSYFVIAKVKDRNGNAYHYSAKLGVKR